MDTSKSLMEYRYLGNSGLKVSVFGYGNMVVTFTPEGFEF